MSKIVVTDGLGFMNETGLGLREVFAVYGNDYPTVDGTHARDYIHVVALQRSFDKNKEDSLEIFNLGTGIGN